MRPGIDKFDERHPSDEIEIPTFHPGEYLSDEIRARGLSLDAFAKMLGWEVMKLSALLSENAPLTKVDAEDIGKALGTSSQLWINLNNAYYGKENIKAKKH